MVRVPNVCHLSLLMGADDCAVVPSRGHPMHLGAPSDCRAHVNDAELGHGVQAMGARLQGHDVLRVCERPEAQAAGVYGWVVPNRHLVPVTSSAVSSLASSTTPSLEARSSNGVTWGFAVHLQQGWTKPNAFHVCITSYQLVVHDAVVFRRKKWYVWHRCGLSIASSAIAAPSLAVRTKLLLT